MHTLTQVCNFISMKGGTSYYVGGYVRDEILGVKSKDIDVEVFGISPHTLKSCLSVYGPVNEVGSSFGVLKLRVAEGEVDFSIPRRDSKAGNGHRGFTAEMDPYMTVKEAASRRDFTINSIYKNVITRKIVDHYHGIGDIVEFKTLDPVSKAFGEDPLRVLRGMQLASRFGLSTTNHMQTASKGIIKEYNTLAVERIGEEWRKWAKGNYPSKGITLLEECGWILLYPELFNMLDVEQDPIYHPEGQVITHVKHVCNAMATICDREAITGEDREVLMFAALCHDMGKPATTVFERERWRSPGHANIGVPIAESFLKSIGIYDRVIQRVLPLIAEHMFPTWEEPTRRIINRLKVRLGVATLDELFLLMEADTSGRPPLPTRKPEGLEKIAELAADIPPKIKPLISGLDILQTCPGITGKDIGKVKAACFEAQLDEYFTDWDEGAFWLQKYLSDNGFDPVIKFLDIADADAFWKRSGYTTPGWYFWDATWTTCHGPYSNRKTASEEMSKYQDSL